jgi:hypothetical protein
MSKLHSNELLYSCCCAPLQCRVSKLLCCLAAHMISMHSICCASALHCRCCHAHPVLSLCMLSLNLFVCNVPYSQELHTHAAAAAAAVAIVVNIEPQSPTL